MSLLSRLSVERKNEILGILALAMTLLISMSLLTYSAGDYAKVNEGLYVSNLGGAVGALLAHYLFLAFGYAAAAVPLLLLLWGLNRVRNAPIHSLLWRTLLLLVLMVLFCHLASLTSHAAGERGFTVGGLLGEGLARYSIVYFGRIGSYLVAVTLLVVTILMTTELGFIPLILRLSERLMTVTRRLGRWILAKSKSIFTRSKRQTSQTRRRAMREMVERRPADTPLPESRLRNEKRREKSRERLVDQQPMLPFPEGPFQLPPLTLLREPIRSERRGERREELEENSLALEKKLADFGVSGEVVQVCPGPVITRYELKPAPGVKVNRIVTLADDLALAMKAQNIRILAPIPGRGVVGIEIPNRDRQEVFFKEIIGSDTFRQSPSKLTLALGKDIEGHPFCADLAQMPHLLVAGSTGSGKSVCINCLICGILYKAHPSEVNFMMIDPKRLELTVYNDIPHMCHRYEEVVTSPKEAAHLLSVAVVEMEERYRKLAREGVRDLKGYNEKVGKSAEKSTLPHLVIVIDELADLMMNSAVSNEVEISIARLAQMARAVGVHLVMATQRPSVDVITGVIKANFPARIAFQVATKIDSRTILDMNGAERLLGRGDMLYMPVGRSEPHRIHGAFISNQEISGIVDFVKGQETTLERYELAEQSEVEEREGIVISEGEGDDELFEEAKRLVIIHQQGSVSLLQRRLGIGYARAGRLIDQLERAGVVGPYEGSKAREVLVSIDELPPNEFGDVGKM